MRSFSKRNAFVPNERLSFQTDESLKTKRFRFQRDRFVSKRNAFAVKAKGFRSYKEMLFVAGSRFLYMRSPDMYDVLICGVLCRKNDAQNGQAPMV